MDLIQLLISAQRLVRANEKCEEGEVIKQWQWETVFNAAKG
jgi:hypothetical protein